MTKTLATTAFAALLFATPVLAQTVSGDAEVQSTITWQNLATKANADRGAKAEGDVAAVKPAMETDAAPAVAAPAQHVTGPSRYNTMEDYWTDRS